MQQPVNMIAIDHSYVPDRRTQLKLAAGIGDQQWDDFLKKCEYCHHEQSSQYAANRQAFGYQCDRVLVKDGGIAVGGVQILVQSTPIGKFAHIQRGPLAVGDDPQVLRQVVHGLEETARKNAYRSVRVDLFPHQTTASNALKDAGFVCSGLWLGAMDSATVPLHLPDDEMLARMHKKVAYEVRRALNKGVTVVTEGENLVDQFYELHQETSIHQKFPIFPREYFVYLWRLLGAAGKVQPFIAYHHGQPLAGLFNTVVGDHMYFGWGGMNRTPEAKKMRANYLLHITAMAWARAHGCSRYDFAGTQRFKQWFAVDIIQWPNALRKVYGPAAGWHWKMMELASSSPLLKHYVYKLSRIIGLQQRMPL